MRFYDQVYQMVRQIPKGRVASYGQIALLCGRTGKYGRSGRAGRDMGMCWKGFWCAGSAIMRCGGIKRWRMGRCGIIFIVALPTAIPR